jgi:quercetin dioxygenase-like cupin family protein
MGETSTFFLATGEQTGGAFCLVDERAKRGDSVPLHRHDEDMESFYVLEGS